MDDNLITEGSEGGQYGFFIHPGETVHLPFKYQSFSVPHSADSAHLESCNKKIFKVCSLCTTFAVGKECQIESSILLHKLLLNFSRF